MSWLMWFFVFSSKHKEVLHEDVKVSDDENKSILSSEASHLTPPSKGADSTEIQKLSKSAKPLYILDPVTLSISEETIKLLDLPSEKIREIDKFIGAFTDQLFALEVSRAYVEISDKNGEVIVVPSFDRSHLHTSLRDKISDLTNKDVARFIADRLAHDIYLGSTNTDIRLSIERAGNGIDRVNFSRRILSEKAFSAEVPLRTLDSNVLMRLGPDSKIDSSMLTTSPTIPIQTSGLLKDTIPSRFRALFDAVEKLPRKQK